jgi:hypothetical protein
MDERQSPTSQYGRESARRSRRRLLRGVGAAIGTASLSTITGAKGSKRTTEPDREERANRGDRGNRENGDPYERSLFLRERAGWSNARWRAYLSKRGISHGTLKRDYAIPRTDPNPDRTDIEDDRATAEKFDRYELTLYVTYSRPWYVSYDVIDLEWEFTDQEFDDFAQSPPDNAAISFRPAHYAPTSAREEWVYYGGSCRDPDGIDSKTPGGALCEWRDIGDRDDRSHFGVYVEPNWQEYDSWERRVYVDFVHTWSGYGLTGVSVGLGGISMGFSRDTDRWDRESSAVEARLLDGERTTG